MPTRARPVQQMDLFDSRPNSPEWNDLPAAVREALALLLRAMLKSAAIDGVEIRRKEDGRDQ